MVRNTNLLSPANSFQAKPSQIPVDELFSVLIVLINCQIYVSHKSGRFVDYFFFDGKYHRISEEDALVSFTTVQPKSCSAFRDPIFLLLHRKHVKCPFIHWTNLQVIFEFHLDCL